MNRRRFSGAMLGAGSLLVAGFTLQSTAAFAKTTDEDDDQDARQSSDDTEAELLEHVVASWQRSYECEEPVTFVTALAVEFDKKRNATDAFDFMRESGLESFEDFEIDDEGEFGDLTDQGYLYYGVSGSGSNEVNVALLYVQQGKYVYAIVSAGVDDQAEVVAELYEILFDEEREETDVLLTEDEMPRGFVMTEDSDDDAGDDTSDDRDRDKDDEDEDDDRGGKKGSRAMHLAMSSIALPGKRSR
ncbi:MAG: hypothetical protein QM753_03120 [Thermomicrobiales bacterium]